MNKGSYIPYIVVFISALLSVAILPIINNEQSGESPSVSYWNDAEQLFLDKSSRKLQYAGENLPVIETDNVYELGKLAALSFIYWVKDNPDGVISLPTGKTPKLFIEYLSYYKNNWDAPKVRRDLKLHGIKLDHFPETKQLKLVQLDEFYPMDPSQKNSFYSYINRHYIDLLGIPKENVLSMNLCSSGTLQAHNHHELFPEGKVDLSLLKRDPVSKKEKLQKQAIKEAQDFCRNYERKIKEMGGIGFLLTGIGPDGHIALNMPGAPFHSKTRLVTLNYPSAAAVAGDLGGIEYSRDKTAVTVGLETITSNKDAVIIVIAAGEAKASVVAEAIEKSKSTDHPATSLHRLKGARFYVTKGAASKLKGRELDNLKRKKWEEITQEEIVNTVTELAIHHKKRIIDLSKSDFINNPKGEALLSKFQGNTRDLLNGARNWLIASIERGLNLPAHRSILHTAPHHDDVELAYYPVIRKLLVNNQNDFAYLTSGFNSVTDKYMLKTLTRIPNHSIDAYAPEIINHDYAFVLRRFINSAENDDREIMKRTESIILMKNICKVYNLKDIGSLKEKIQWLKNDYFPNRQPGEKDTPTVQILKGTMRESETERMLLMAGVTLPRIHHLRASFYNGSFFDPVIALKEDAKPVQKLCDDLNPNILTVALDPEGTGPDTHYKVLQVVAEALRGRNQERPSRIWGYRNVWYRFKLSEANMMIPVNEDEMSRLNLGFLACFSTQRTASFPTSSYDGPFCWVVDNYQRIQLAELKTLLGEAYFNQHPSEEIRNASGFIFLKEMTQEEFLKSAAEIKERTELTEGN